MFEQDDSKILVLNGNKCMYVKKSTECPASYFFDFATNDCQTCDITCVECSDYRESSCLKCNDRRPYLQEGLCVDECDLGFYLDKKLKKCIRCGPNCQICEEDRNQCKACKIGFSLDDKKKCQIDVLYGNLISTLNLSTVRFFIAI